ncbi:SWIM zinc finger family protein [Actinidia rufa]|uniref:SWIM zinc finger family protein n=1 Tax=Actinidia rufa TaxID=165716 RepID=A0A7J0DIR5_9ERIC|nr:SWIM zinc finger family protein [Actinidia rufa]
MESVPSTSTPRDRQFEITQPVADRIIRALGHRICLLHRSESNFFVLGATRNVYTVTLSATPSCTCPDRTTPCKHILFVFIRVLGLSLDDTCLRRRTLRPCQLIRLLGTPTSPQSLAGAGVRERFHQIFFQERPGSFRANVDVEDGTVCPVCLDEMGPREKVVACGTCRNPIHEECLRTWKRISRRRTATCVICRSRWRTSTSDQETYLNLSAYVSEDDQMAEANSFCGD